MQTHIYDASGGIVKTVTYEPQEKKWIFGYSQHTEPYLDHNKSLATWDDGFSPSREFRRLASIPFGVLLKWLQDDGVTQLRYMRMTKGERHAWLMKKVRDPDNAVVLNAPHKRPRRGNHNKL